MTVREARFYAGLATVVVATAFGAASAGDAAKTHQVVAKVVAVDLQANSIRVNLGTGPSQSFPVVGKAIEHLDEIAIGGMFKLTVQDADGAAQEAVIAIKRARKASQI